MISSKRVAMATVQQVSSMYISGAKFEEHCFFILYLVFYHFSCAVISFLICIIQKHWYISKMKKDFPKRKNSFWKAFQTCRKIKNGFDVWTSMIWTLFVLMFTTYTVVQCIVAGEAYLKSKNPYNQWVNHLTTSLGQGLCAVIWGQTLFCHSTINSPSGKK